MINRTFLKTLMKQSPDIRCIDNYFYFQPVNEILSGFCLEKSARGSYIWKLVYPLFDPQMRIHLTYSKRIPGENGFISNKERNSSKNIADIFYEKISPFIEDMKSLSNCAGFNDYVCDNEDLLINPTIRAVYACSNVMLNRYQFAESQFVQAINMIENYGGSIAETSIEEVYLNLRKNPSTSIKILLQNIEKTKSKLQLEQK